MSQRIGTVAAIARYPVKSMAAEPVQALDLHWSGANGDRQYGFVQSGNKGRFPWLTGRELASLLSHRPAYDNPEDPRLSPLTVTTPEGERLAVTDPALAARLSTEAGREVSLIQIGRGVFDAMPVSLASTAGLAAIAAAHGSPLDARRFRLNIIIESEMRDAEWQGRRLAFGTPEGAAVLVNHGIPRCVMITIDPDTLARDPSVMKTVAKQFANQAGQYAATARLGPIRAGDAVFLAD